MNTREVILKARTIMKQRGMCKHQLEDHTGRVCGAGAILAAVSPEGSATDFGGYYGEAMSEVAKHVPKPFHGIPHYNNHPKTTLDDMLDLFCRAAQACDQEKEPA
jgi:hypothetical protein